jgi:hypothetical protein
MVLKLFTCYPTCLYDSAPCVGCFVRCGYAVNRMMVRVVCTTCMYIGNMHMWGCVVNSCNAFSSCGVVGYNEFSAGTLTMNT